MDSEIDRAPLTPWLPKAEPTLEAVLDATERAIVRHGVPGGGFAEVAGAGGFSAAIPTLHFDAPARLLLATLRRVVEVYAARASKLLDEVPPEATLRVWLGWLFSPFGADGPPRQARVVDAFIAAAPTWPDAAAELRILYGHFTARLADAIAEHCLDAHPDDRTDAAHAVVCLSFGRAGLDTLRLSAARGPAARRAAEAILAPIVGRAAL
jgi:AcrR family transcriptional regulator